MAGQLRSRHAGHSVGEWDHYPCEGSEPSQGSREEIQAEVDGYQAQISDLQERVALLKARIPLWIDVSSIAITLLLLWLALSQVSIFFHGWSFFTGQDLLARWR